MPGTTLLAMQPEPWRACHIAAALAALAVLVLAWWRGGGPERGCALVMCVLALAAIGLDMASSRPDAGLMVLAADLLVLLALLAIALRANRFYPLVMASCALIAAVAQVLATWRPGVATAGWTALVAGPQAVAMLALAAGLVAHARRRARIGEYPDWRG